MICEVKRGVYSYPVPELDYEANRYYEASRDGKPYGYVHVQRVCDVGHIHLYIVYWSAGYCRELHKDWAELKDILRKMGITQVIVSYPIDNTSNRWYRFIQRLGFERPRVGRLSGKDVLVSRVNIGY